MNHVRAGALLVTLLVAGPGFACLPPPADAPGLAEAAVREAAAACAGTGPARAELEALKAAGWAVADDEARQRLALGLLDCLGHPDPALRDGIAYEALAHWLRAGALDLLTRRAMLARLQRDLAGPDLAVIDMSCVGPAPGVSTAGFRAPFAALVLAELARSDRVAPWLDAAQRAELVEVGTMKPNGAPGWRASRIRRRSPRGPRPSALRPDSRSGTTPAPSCWPCTCTWRPAVTRRWWHAPQPSSTRCARSTDQAGSRTGSGTLQTSMCRAGRL